MHEPSDLKLTAPVSGLFQLLDHIPAGVFILSHDFRVIYWNRCMEEWTSLTRETMAGTVIFSHFPHLQAPRYLNRIRDIFGGGPPTVFSAQLHKHFIPSPLPGGKLRIQYTVVTGLPSGEKGRYHAIFSIQDVTSLTEAIENYSLEHRKLLAEMEERRKIEVELQRSAGELQRLNKVLKERSIRDGLTGLYNHRHFYQTLRRDFLLARRHETDMACVLIDLDFFKKVNDAYGHTFGDSVLKGVARQIRVNARKTDVVSRYGGEEFAVLLPSTDIAGARVFAEAVRERIAGLEFRNGGETVRITASIGIATLWEHRPAAPQKLLDCADIALYRAKELGRNRIAVYSGTETGETTTGVATQPQEA